MRLHLYMEHKRQRGDEAPTETDTQAPEKRPLRALL